MGRERPETQEAFKKIHDSFPDRDARPFVRRMLNFQFFVSALLIVLVILTATSFSFTLRSEREARELTEQRQMLFERYVTNILSSIEDSQEQGNRERRDIVLLLEEIHADLANDISEMQDPSD